MPDLVGILWRRAVTHWVLKLQLATAMQLVFMACYMLPQRYPLFPPATLEPFRWETAIAFSDRLLVVYFLNFPLLCLTPLLTTSRKDLVEYALGFTIVTTIAGVCFVFFPVTGPLPAEVAAGPAYRIIPLLDRPTNCIPSLHATYCVLACLLGWRIVQHFGAGIRALYTAAAFATTLAVLYSALELKQHYAIDFVPGLLLGFAAFPLARLVKRAASTS